MKSLILRKSLLVLVLFYSVSVFAGHDFDCNDESQYPLISKKELSETIAKNEAVIIDVNSAESFNKVHVPGAIHFRSHEKDFSKLLPVNKKALIIAYCGSEKCRAWMKAAQQACNLGYRNIRHFKEGIKGWVSSG